MHTGESSNGQPHLQLSSGQLTLQGHRSNSNTAADWSGAASPSPGPPARTAAPVSSHSGLWLSHLSSEPRPSVGRTGAETQVRGRRHTQTHTHTSVRERDTHTNERETHTHTHTTESETHTHTQVRSIVPGPPEQRRSVCRTTESGRRCPLLEECDTAGGNLTDR